MVQFWTEFSFVQGIGLVLDADKRVIAWDCVFVSNGVNKEQRCRAEVRLEGGDGTIASLSLSLIL